MQYVNEIIDQIADPDVAEACPAKWRGILERLGTTALFEVADVRVT